MISNQILQDTIDGLKGITRTDLCVLDTEGKVLASTLKDIDDCEDSVRAFVDSPAESQVVRALLSHGRKAPESVLQGI